MCFHQLSPLTLVLVRAHYLHCKHPRAYFTKKELVLVACSPSTYWFRSHFACLAVAWPVDCVDPGEVVGEYSSEERGQEAVGRTGRGRVGEWTLVSVVCVRRNTCTSNLIQLKGFTYNLVSLVSNSAMALPNSGTNCMQMSRLLSSWLTRPSHTGD